MQYVQTPPPVYTPTSPTADVPAARAVPAVQPVAPHAPSELLLRRLDTQLPALEQRWVRRPPSVENERRKVCRRILHDPVLEELRSGMDRRRRNQRSNDLTTAIDEKI